VKVDPSVEREAFAAPHTREAVREDPAGQVSLELRLHEPRKADAVVDAGAGFLQEGAEVIADGGKG